MTKARTITKARFPRSRQGLDLQGVTNVHLSNVHFVLRDISALLDPSWLGLVIAHFHLLSMERIERGGGEGMKGRREVVRPIIWQRTKCTFEKCTFVDLGLEGCLLPGFLFFSGIAAFLLRSLLCQSPKSTWKIQKQNSMTELLSLISL